MRSPDSAPGGRGDAAPAWLDCEALPATGGELGLEADAVHYLRRVVRARAGDAVRVTDGRGGVATARWDGGGRAAIERMEVVPRRAALTLACGSPEGERADWLIEKLAELGVAAFVPLVTARGEWPRAGQRRDRWERLTRAALRQSCQAWRLVLHEPVGLADWLADVPAGERWLADPAGDAPGGRPGAGPGVAAVGPAAGFTSDERARLLAAGFAPLRLAPGRLRAETAALAIAVHWAACAGAS